MKKTSIFFLMLFCLLSVPLSAWAFMAEVDDSVYVGPEDTVEGNLYAAGSNITIDGTVTGDVICGAQTVNINGKVEGDVICGAQAINITGEVGGSARVAGNAININGRVARGVQAFGATIALGKEASVGWDMFLAGAAAEIRGKVGRDLHGAAASAVIDGEIGKNVRLRMDDGIQAEKKGINFDKQKSSLKITNNAKIGGDVTYTAGQAGDFAEGASIMGEIKHNLPKAGKKKSDFALGYLWGRIFSIFAALVVGLVIVSLWHEPIKKLTDKMLKKTAAGIGWGIVIMFVAPILAVILMFTLIGFPLAFILLAVWAIALYLSKILTAILVGRSLMDKMAKGKKKDSLIWAMIIGVVLTWIIYSIPLIGWLLALAAMWWGLGGLWLYFKKT